LGTVRTHYLAETAEGKTLTYPAGSTLLLWGIDTSKNRWWKADPGDFGSVWAAPSTFTITGVAADIAEIVLAIDCDTGIFTETWPA